MRGNWSWRPKRTMTIRRRPSTPAEQALYSLVRALNPAVSGYDPLGAGRRAGPTTLMGKGEDAFFENAGGIVPRRRSAADGQTLAASGHRISQRVRHCRLSRTA